MAERVAVVVLAGGEATRLPGKLALNAGDAPLLARVFRNVSPGRTTVISCKDVLPPDIARLIDARAIPDRWSQRGPLSGLLSALDELTAPWVFAVAGDAPFVDASFIDVLEARIAGDDEAIVPRRLHAGKSQIEPLAALYRVDAFVREGFPILRTGNGSVRSVIDRLNTRFVDIENERVFTNINTPDDYASLRHVLS